MALLYRYGCRFGVGGRGLFDILEDGLVGLGVLGFGNFRGFAFGVVAVDCSDSSRVVWAEGYGKFAGS